MKHREDIKCISLKENCVDYFVPISASSGYIMRYVISTDHEIYAFSSLSRRRRKRRNNAWVLSLTDALII